MAKKRKSSRIYPNGTKFIRDAVPTPKDVASFVAPRTVEDGLSVANVFGDIGEMTPFAGAVPYAERELGLRDYSDEDIMLAAILGFPILGKARNLKEALGNRGWSNAKYRWTHNKPNAHRLYENIDMIPKQYQPGTNMSTTSRINRTQDIVPTIDVFGPHQVTNTGSNVQNYGRQVRNTNNNTTTGHSGGVINGRNVYQGDMYPSGRSLRKDDFVGPQQWESPYSQKLDAVIDENEAKWEYLINKTRASSDPRNIVLPKEELIEIALKQGRPDIAARVLSDTKPRVSLSANKKFNSYNSAQTKSKLSDAEWKDFGNRQVEKELREEFASLSNDPNIRYRFADYYGVPDLYQSWIDNPESWEDLNKNIKRIRQNRENANRYLDNKFGRNVKR